MTMQVTEVQRVLGGADYPADGPTLADLARRHDGPDELIAALDAHTSTFGGPDEVMHALKGSLGGATDGS